MKDEGPMNNRTLHLIQDKIKDIIISVAETEIDKSMIESGDNDIQRLDLNSLNMIKMLVEIEKEFDIEIDFEETSPEIWSSLDSLSNYILSLK